MQQAASSQQSACYKSKATYSSYRLFKVVVRRGSTSVLVHKIQISGFALKSLFTDSIFLCCVRPLRLGKVLYRIFFKTTPFTASFHSTCSREQCRRIRNLKLLLIVFETKIKGGTFSAIVLRYTCFVAVVLYFLKCIYLVA